METFIQVVLGQPYITAGLDKSKIDKDSPPQSMKQIDRSAPLKNMKLVEFSSFLKIQEYYDHSAEKYHSKFTSCRCGCGCSYSYLKLPVSRVSNVSSCLSTGARAWPRAVAEPDRPCNSVTVYSLQCTVYSVQ